VLPYAHRHCHLDEDLKLAQVVLTDLRRLHRYDEQRLVDRTLAVLLSDWSSVEALAQALVERRHLDADEVKAIMCSRHDLQGLAHCGRSRRNAGQANRISSVVQQR
jgi:hypothetical protein